MSQRLISMTWMIPVAVLVSACAQPPERPNCPTAAQMEQPELLGRWSVEMSNAAEVPGQRGPIILDLRPHPEWDGTVKGQVHRPGYSSIIVGDVNKGELTMEESRDGKSVSGNWAGTVVENSCAREIRGEWMDSDDRTANFVMRKLAH